MRGGEGWRVGERERVRCRDRGSEGEREREREMGGGCFSNYIE